MNIVPLIITIVGGILVLLSYYLVFKDSKTSYLDSKYWLGQPKSVVKVFFILQLLAVIGFFLFMGTPKGWLFGDAPNGGILGNKIVFAVVLAIFFISSASWAFLAKKGLNGSKIAAIGCVTSLIISAICAILFVAGAVEEDKSRWYVVLGTILFAITIVLSDGVAWNAKFIKQVFN